jgi:hypothetical protein
LQQTLRVVAAVSLAAIVSFYFFNNFNFWLILTAFMLAQVNQYMFFRKGLELACGIVLGVVLAGLLTINVHQALIIYVVVMVFIVSGYLFDNWLLETNKLFLHILFFSITFSFAVSFPVQTIALIRDRLGAVVLGAVVGAICGQLIFPFNVIDEFQKKLLPVLQALSGYMQTIIEKFLHKGITDTKVTEIRLRLEQTLRTRPGTYPEWVYEVGFNPGLRSGFRFFLINVERLIEIIFSMNYLVAGEIDDKRLQEIADYISVATERNVELITLLISFFQKKEIYAMTNDFTNDILDLDSALNRVVPGGLALLDTVPDYMLLIALVRCIKDMRCLLLQLVTALPTSDCYKH